MDEQSNDLQNPDEARPIKRVRLEAPLTVTEETQREAMDEDDWDDVYDNTANSTAKPADAQSSAAVGEPSTPAAANPPQREDTGPTNTSPSAPHEHQYGVTLEANETQKVADDGVPADAIDTGDNLVAPPPQPPLENNDHASVRVMEDTTNVEYQPAAASTASDRTMIDAKPLTKSTEDPDFMAAAAAQKGSKTAEWQFDSSDAESSDSDSSDSDTSSEDSDSGSEGGYEMLDPATMAKILMSGDGDDDGDDKKNKSGTEHQPRTANEVKEQVVPKPDVEITPETKITFLGTVERAVENMVLIKGATPGEYQVLEGGSVLCNDKREVIGAVADTFGRVQEPLYSVAFTNDKEIEDAGLEFGAKVFYVDNHSTFIFTQPLKNMKHTDASNIHDEEVGEDEQEFSDDEQEAEFKRQRKMAKKAGRGGLSRSAFQSGARVVATPGHDRGESYMNASDAPTQTYGSGMTYDDEPAEEFYQPLKRPDNLSQLMAGGGPPSRPPPFSDRGRGRGRGDRGRGDRGRGRGDRGRGRGGFEQRGGRGGHQHQGGAFRGNSQSYDRYNGHSEHSLPSKPQVPSAPPAHQQQQQPPQYPMPSNYQFNGYTFQYGNQAPPAAPQQTYYSQQQQQPQPPPQFQAAAGQMSAGAYVNPAFFQQQPPTQAPQAYNAWNSQYQQQYAQTPNNGAPPPPPGAQQPQQQQQQPQPPSNVDLSSILKSLGAPQ